MLGDEDKIQTLEDLLKIEKKGRENLENKIISQNLKLQELNQKLSTQQIILDDFTLRESHKFNRFSNLKDAYIKMDLEGKILQMNASAQRLFESPKDAQKLSIKNLIHPDYFEYALSSFKKLIKEGSIENFVAQVNTNAIPPKFIQINANLLYTVNNKAEAVEGIIRDITISKTFHDDLASQKEEFANIFEHSPLSIAISKNSYVIKSNVAFQKMLGYSQEELSLLNTTELFLPHLHIDVKHIRDDLDNQNKSKMEFESLMFKKNKEVIKVKINTNNILNSDGQIKYRISIIEDITNISLQNQLIEEQKKQLEIIVDNSPLGIALYTESIFTKTNKAFSELLGYSEKELSNMSFEDITFIADKSQLSKARHRIKLGEIDRFSIKKRLQRKNGELILVNATVSAVKNSEGELLYEIVIVEDITEQAKIELQEEELLFHLEKSNEELKEYAHIVSHDLKTPLRSLSTFVSWMKEDYKEKMDDNVLGDLNMIQNTVEHMEALINGILSYSEITSSKISQSAVNVHEVVTHVIKMLSIPSHVKVEIKETLPTICGNEIRLGQLFQNLISNAVKYCEKAEGKVSVAYLDDPKYWIFKIHDNGIGIPKKYQSKIFGLFQTLHTEDRFKSTGIGLAIVKRIVSIYHGKISVESKMGVGSTFTVHLKKPDSTIDFQTK